jgi:hypothetical protein
MIDLVLEHPGEQVSASEDDAAPPDVPSLYLDPLCPTDVAVHARDAEAAFDAYLRPSPTVQAWVHHRERAGSDIDNQDA